MRAPRPIFPALLAAALLFAFTAPVEAGGVNMGTLRPLVIAILDSLGVTENGGTPVSGSGDITAVVAGDGLTDGGTTGSVTLNVAVGTGLTAAADEITLDEELVDVAGVSPTDNSVLAGTGSALAMETLTSLIDSAMGSTRGQILYRNATVWTVLAPGTAGQVLESGGAGADVAWGTDGGGSAGPFHVFLASQGIAPASNFATFTTRGASTNGAHGVLAFDQTTAEAIVFEGVLSSGYSDASDLTVSIYWTTSATSGSAVWSAEVEAIDGLDIDADSFDTAENSAASAASATSGIYSVATISLANAEADAIAAGEPFRLRIARVPSDGGDDLAADAQLLRVVVSQ